ncbi:Acetyltransferase [compost metagenome]
MSEPISVIPLDGLTPPVLHELSRLLTDTVEDGASIGFLPPLAEDEATAYWQGVHGPGVLLWVAMDGEAVAGTVQLHLALKPNGAHRAELAKLMVHPDHRRKGIAGMLIDAAERAAAAHGRTLIVLDTREGDPSNLLYLSRGYIEAGRIPDFAISAEGGLDTTVLYYKKL